MTRSTPPASLNASATGTVWLITQMDNHQLGPLEVNPHTGEPFLRLRKHKNIILTPPRKEDTTVYVKLLNDPKVHEWLKGPPFPYTPEDAEDWFKICSGRTEEVLSKLNAARDEARRILVASSPVRAIREIKDDGTDELIGDIELGRVREARLLVLPKREEATEEEKEEALKKNNDLPLGDQNALFMVGYYLAPSHHGQGIMTDALDTLLWEWGVPRMGIRKILSSAFEGNFGSARVFEKNGFKLTQTLGNFMVVKGRTRGLYVLEWEHPVT